MTWMLYGANGYTGRLIAEEAARRSERPILAGRSAEKIEPLARALGFESRIFDVDHPRLDGVKAVLHCAGPFSRTSAPMVRACLDAGAHYLDITGEYQVFDAVLSRHDDAVRRGIALLPGVGFDVVPTDCLAAMLAEKLPNADELQLAFASRRGGISPGTMKTSIESIGQGVAIRRDGRIVTVPLLHDVRKIPFPGGERTAVAIPWGDVVTAYATTGIPNITVYTARSEKSIAKMRRLAPFERIGAIPFVNRLIKKMAEKNPGPDAATRAAAHVELWGRVAKKTGEEATMTMITPEGYTFTVVSSLRAVQRLLAEPLRAGAHTPSKYFGAHFAEECGATLP